MCVCVVFSLTASQAAAQARNRAGQQSAAASSITGMSLQEAQQILNISTLTPEEIQKVKTPSSLSLRVLTDTLFVLGCRAIKPFYNVVFAGSKSVCIYY